MGPDVRYIGTWPPIGHEPTLEHLVAVTTAAEDAGCEGLLVATAYTNYLENLTTAAAVLGRTRSARMLLAIRPNQFHPVQAAKIIASLQTLFPGRIELNVVTGGWEDDAWIEIRDDREQRFRRVREWFDIVNGLWYGDFPFSYRGETFHVEEVRLYPAPPRRMPIFLSGFSLEARELAVREADVYLIFGSTVEEVAAEVQQMRALDTARRLRYAVRFQVIVRKRARDAWQAAERLISRVDPDLRAKLTAPAPDGRPQGTARDALARGELQIGPNLWVGVGMGRFGVSTALVGSPAEIVERLLEYRACGIDTFVLSGFPKLEEARRFGSLVTPLLREAELERTVAARVGR
jgi:alkanesulfonate monooxygenase